MTKVAGVVSAVALLTGCVNHANEGARSLVDILGSVQALEKNPVDDLNELADRSDIVLTGRITSVEVSSPVYATPDPGTPEATYGGQVLIATVKPGDGSDAVMVEFIYQFSGDHALNGPEDVELPDQELVFSLIPTPDSGSTTYRCVADSTWCPLEWNGEGLESASWDEGTLPVDSSDPHGTGFASIDEVTAEMVDGTEAVAVG
jgi:hypothetical protein